MMRHSIRSTVSSTATPGARRCVQVVLLNKEELTVFTEGKARVQDVFHQACDHLGLRETEYFGLALIIEGEYQFQKSDTKLHKLAPKAWKAKVTGETPQPVLTFYFRVQFYVNHITLLKERVTRSLYYLQLRDNLLNHSQAVTEDKCFLNAATALQADCGDYTKHRTNPMYFDPREYFPAWMVSKHGTDYLLQHMPTLHKDMTGLTKMEAQMQFIRDISLPPTAHNLHFYQLKKRKTDEMGSIWMGICPRGIEIHEVIEYNNLKSLLSTFPWPEIDKLHHDKKKFELGTKDKKKFMYYTGSDERSKYLFMLSSETHRFHMSMQPRLGEIRHMEETDKRYRESYIYCENTETSWENSSVHSRSSIHRGLSGRHSPRSVSGRHSPRSISGRHSPRSELLRQRRMSLISSSSTTTSGIVSDRQHASLDESEEDSSREIMITSPPMPQPVPWRALVFSSRPGSNSARSTTPVLAPVVRSMMGHPSVSRSSSGHSQKSGKFPVFPHGGSIGPMSSTPLRPSFSKPTDPKKIMPPPSVINNVNMLPTATVAPSPIAADTHMQRTVFQPMMVSSRSVNPPTTVTRGDSSVSQTSRAYVTSTPLGSRQIQGQPTAEVHNQWDDRAMQLVNQQYVLPLAQTQHQPLSHQGSNSSQRGRAIEQFIYSQQQQQQEHLKHQEQLQLQQIQRQQLWQQQIQLQQQLAQQAAIQQLQSEAVTQDQLLQQQLAQKAAIQQLQSEAVTQDQLLQQQVDSVNQYHGSQSTGFVPQTTQYPPVETMENQLAAHYLPGAYTQPSVSSIYGDTPVQAPVGTIYGESQLVPQGVNARRSQPQTTTIQYPSQITSVLPPAAQPTLPNYLATQANIPKTTAQSSSYPSAQNVPSGLGQYSSGMAQNVAQQYPPVSQMYNQGAVPAAAQQYQVNKPVIQQTAQVTEVSVAHPQTANAMPKVNPLKTLVSQALQPAITNSPTITPVPQIQESLPGIQQVPADVITPPTAYGDEPVPAEISSIEAQAKQELDDLSKLKQKGIEELARNKQKLEELMNYLEAQNLQEPQDQLQSLPQVVVQETQQEHENLQQETDGEVAIDAEQQLQELTRLKQQRLEEIQLNQRKQDELLLYLEAQQKLEAEQQQLLMQQEEQQQALLREQQQKQMQQEQLQLEQQQKKQLQREQLLLQREKQQQQLAREKQLKIELQQQQLEREQQQQREQLLQQQQLEREQHQLLQQQQLEREQQREQLIQQQQLEKEQQQQQLEREKQKREELLQQQQLEMEQKQLFQQQLDREQQREQLLHQQQLEIEQQQFFQQQQLEREQQREQILQQQQLEKEQQRQREQSIHQQQREQEMQIEWQKQQQQLEIEKQQRDQEIVSDDNPLQEQEYQQLLYDQQQLKLREQQIQQQEEELLQKLKIMQLEEQQQNQQQQYADPVYAQQQYTTDISHEWELLSAVAAQHEAQEVHSGQYPSSSRDVGNYNEQATEMSDLLQHQHIILAMKAAEQNPEMWSQFLANNEIPQHYFMPTNDINEQYGVPKNDDEIQGQYPVDIQYMYHNDQDNQEHYYPADVPEHLRHDNQGHELLAPPYDFQGEPLIDFQSPDQIQDPLTYPFNNNNIDQYMKVHPGGDGDLYSKSYSEQLMSVQQAVDTTDSIDQHHQMPLHQQYVYQAPAQVNTPISQDPYIHSSENNPPPPLYSETMASQISNPTPVVSVTRSESQPAKNRKAADDTRESLSANVTRAQSLNSGVLTPSVYVGNHERASSDGTDTRKSIDSLKMPPPKSTSLGTSKRTDDLLLVNLHGTTGSHHPWCPKHNLNPSCMEEVRAKNSSMPMLSALLNARDLLQCRCNVETEENKRKSYAHPAPEPMWNEPGTVVRPMSWHLGNFTPEQTMTAFKELNIGEARSNGMEPKWDILRTEVGEVRVNGLDMTVLMNEGNSPETHSALSSPSLIPAKLNSGGHSPKNSETVPHKASLSIA